MKWSGKRLIITSHLLQTFTPIFAQLHNKQRTTAVLCLKVGEMFDHNKVGVVEKMKLWQRWLEILFHLSYAIRNFRYIFREVWL